MRYALYVATIAIIIGGGIGALLKSRGVDYDISPVSSTSTMAILSSNSTSTGANGYASTSSAVENSGTGRTGYADIENQKPLVSPPEIIKAVYATAWSAGSPSKVQYFKSLIKDSELNAIVIDIKDYSGHVLYDNNNPDVVKYDAKLVEIPRINQLIKELHDDGIYVIARVTVFQDPMLAKARPELAIHDKRTGGIWYDHKKLSWIDPAAHDAWDYNVTIAKDALARGFDEVNFDYVRFASDGDLGNMAFPFYSGKVSKRAVIREFFKYLRDEMGDGRLSADLFGLTTVNNDDLGIGQTIRDAARYFDYVAPMVYPSHYASGFIGYKNPASYPYEVVKYSMERAKIKLTTPEATVKKTSNASTTLATSTTPIAEAADASSTTYRAKLRPWLQDFDLGAVYDADKVKAQIRALNEIIGGTNLYDGWMLWSPANIYTKSALGV